MKCRGIWLVFMIIFQIFILNTEMNFFFLNWTRDPLHFFNSCWILLRYGSVLASQKVDSISWLLSVPEKISFFKDIWQLVDCKISFFSKFYEINLFQTSLLCLKIKKICCFYKRSQPGVRLVMKTGVLIVYPIP